MAENSEGFKNLEKLVGYTKDTAHRKLNFIDLDKSSLRLMLFTDAAFGNRTYLSSQLGYNIALADGYGNANIFHYGSQKCRRITRSAMAAELMGLITFLMKHFV